MTFLSTSKTKSSDPLTKYVGAYLPVSITSRLDIYRIANDINRTKLFEAILKEWLDTNFDATVENQCIETIVERIYAQFVELKTIKRSLTYQSFISTLITEMEYKGLTTPMIKRILTQLDIKQAQK